MFEKFLILDTFIIADIRWDYLLAIALAVVNVLIIIHAFLGIKHIICRLGQWHGIANRVEYGFPSIGVGHGSLVHVLLCRYSARGNTHDSWPVCFLLNPKPLTQIRKVEEMFHELPCSVDVYHQLWSARSRFTFPYLSKAGPSGAARRTEWPADCNNRASFPAAYGCDGRSQVTTRIFRGW